MTLAEDIQKTAREIIANEAVCIEWGAPTARSIQLTVDAINELIARHTIKSIIPDAPPEIVFRSERQKSTLAWALRCFEENEVRSLPQRGLRLLEEACEAAQATGLSYELALVQINEVWSREPGELQQELGGVGVTALVLAAAAGLDADACEAAEVQRILNKPVEHFKARNADKNSRGLRAVE